MRTINGGVSGGFPFEIQTGMADSILGLFSIIYTYGWQ
jgi:hypothetical protein